MSLELRQALDIEIIEDSETLTLSNRGLPGSLDDIDGGHTHDNDCGHDHDCDCDKDNEPTDTDNPDGPPPPGDNAPDGPTFADIAGNTSTTGTISIGGSVSNVLEVSLDQDWFRIDLVAGERYSIALNGSGSNPLLDPYLRLLDSNGNQLELNDDGGAGRNSLLNFTADYTGTYYISAQSWIDPSNNMSSTGDYTLTVGEAAPIGERTIDGVAHFLTDEFSARRSWDQTTITYNVSQLSAGAQLLAEQALQAWADVTPLNFVEVASGSADITFQDTASGAYSSSSFSGGTILSSTINIASNWNGGRLDFDSYTYQTYLHEIGHSLGLGHGGPYNGSATYGVDNIYLNDTWSYTVMSYFSQTESGYGDFRYVLGPQIADIVAIQDLYGANTTTRSGDTVYGFNSTETDVHDFSQFTRAPSLSIYDTGGIDTLDFSGYSQAQNINLNAEEFSDVNGLDFVISIARGTIIENAIGGSGVDHITGNDADNVLTGNAGNDILDGGAGTDYAAYNLGSITDYTIVDNGDGSFTVTANSGNEGSDTLTNIEFLQINGTNYALGGTPDFTEGDDTFTGTSGDDISDGLGGDDEISGEGGNDRLYGRDGSDMLNGGTGNDYLSGGADDDFIFGGSGRDTIWGGSHNDTIDAGDGNDNVNAGSGNDTVLGGAGNDSINGANGRDVIEGGDGNDTLLGGSARDILRGGDGDDFLDGGSARDYLSGGAGDDELFGGSGDDKLYGGSGNDTIDAGDDDDAVNAGSGNDTVMGGSGNDEINGSTGHDVIDGGSGNDTLEGGRHNDTLTGGSGSDDFIFSGNFDNDMITDYDANDDDEDIDLSGVGSITDFNDLVNNHMTQDGNDVIIDDGNGNTITLTGVDLDDLDQQDFLF